MKYKGVEITQSVYGTFHLISPVNGTKRIFRTLDRAKNYIDNAWVLDSHAKALSSMKD